MSHENLFEWMPKTVKYVTEIDMNSFFEDMVIKFIKSLKKIQVHIVQSGSCFIEVRKCIKWFKGYFRTYVCIWFFKAWVGVRMTSLY